MYIDASVPRIAIVIKLSLLDEALVLPSIIIVEDLSAKSKIRDD